MAEWSDFYESQMSYDRHLQAHYLREMTKTILQYWRGGPILEVGTGTGYMAIYLSKLGIPVSAVDNDMEILENSRWANQILEGSAEFILCDAFELETRFKDEKFDLVFHQGLFEHFSDDEIRTMIDQQLQVADRIICSVPSKYYPEQDYGNERLLSTDQWRGILMPYQGSIKEIGYFGHTEKTKEHVHFVLENQVKSDKDSDYSQIMKFKKPVIPKIVWESLIFHPSGYASIARNSAVGMQQKGVRVSLKSLPSTISTPLDAETQQKLYEMIKTPAKPGSPYVYHHPPAGHKGERFFKTAKKENPGMGKYICSMMFETDRIPADWVNASYDMDEVWVPTHFNKKTFSGSGIPEEKIKIVPFGIDTKLFDPSRAGNTNLPGKKSFNFLSVFEWTKRKGWDVLLEAYLKEFDYREDVSLTLIVYRGTGTDQNDAENISIKAYRYMTEVLGMDPEKKPHINLVDSVFSYQDMPALYKAADVFVLPTRGEGWGMPYMESMAMGVPVIATDWSGHLEFVTAENGYLIDITGLEDVDEEQVKDNPYYKGHKWANPSTGSLRKLMRHTFENTEEVKEKGKRALRDVRSKFSLGKAGEYILNRLTEIYENENINSKQIHESAGIPPVIWEAPVFDPSGYAADARNLIFGISRETGTDLTVSPVFWSNLKIGLSKSDEIELVDLSTLQSPDKKTAVNVQHVFPPMFKIDKKAKLSIGRTMFETDRIPADWVKPCNKMDAIFVPTDFNIGSFTKAGVKKEKLFKLPFSLDPGMFDRHISPLFIPERKKFNFLSVFDWSYRKGWDILIGAFLEEFSAVDDVSLIIQTYSSYGLSNSGIVGMIQQFINENYSDKGTDLARIVMMQRVLSEKEMIQLYAASDCFVLPSRGEGWGRPYMEAMAMAKPVIGTKWSGNLEYMNDSNSYLIDCNVVDVPEFAWKEIPTFKGHKWAEPSKEHLRKLMRHVTENRDEVLETGEKARSDMLNKYNRRNVAEIFINNIKKLLGEEVFETELIKTELPKTEPEELPIKDKPDIKIKKPVNANDAKNEKLDINPEEPKPDDENPLPLFSDLG